MSNEQIYLYRRKGLSDYATCDRARYVELSQHKLFETMICYASAEAAERLGIDLELTRLARQGDQIEIDGLKALNDGLRAELGECKGEYDRAVNKVDAMRAQLAEAHSLFSDVLSIDVPRTAQSLERMRSILSDSAEPNNQCDGCRAGIPLINGMHRMGKPGEYPDLMACTSKRYDYDPDEPANKKGAQ